jgi:uncharacterized protein YjbJ (UPF0337 family)
MAWRDHLRAHLNSAGIGMVRRANGYGLATWLSRRGHRRKEMHMSANADKAKGHIKEAVGDLTDDKDLEREGKVDELAGKAKEAVDTAKDKLTGKD